MEKYIKNSNIPDAKVKVCMASGILKNIEKIESKYNLKFLKTQKCNNVYDEIAYHPDIQMIHLKDNNIVITLDMFNVYEMQLKELGFNCIKGNSELKDKYPYDTIYNGCIIGKYFIHNLKYTDKILLEEIDKLGLESIQVNQGYTKCNISILNENNIITGDRGLEKILSKYFNVLYIQTEGQIQLGNMDGFIGGATGLISKDTWCINGDINTLKDCNKIKEFIDMNNMQIECINEGKIVDIGSIIPLIYE